MGGDVKGDVGAAVRIRVAGPFLTAEVGCTAAKTATSVTHTILIAVAVSLALARLSATDVLALDVTTTVILGVPVASVDIPVGVNHFIVINCH